MKKYFIVKKVEGASPRTDWFKICSEETLKSELDVLRDHSTQSYTVYKIDGTYCDVVTETVEKKKVRVIHYDEV